MTDRPNNQDADVADFAHLSEDELSAYINGDITDVDDLQRRKAHLETCASCRESLSELRAVVWLLRGAENPVPSRSFRLDPSMVSAPVVRIDPWIVRVQPTLRRLTAIAAAFLVILVVADVLAHQNSGQDGTRTVAFSAATTQSTSGSSAVSAAAPALSAAGNESRSVQSTAATPASAAAAATDVAKTSEAGTPVTAAGESPAAATNQPDVALPPPSNASESSGTSYWRLIELAAGVVVTWLLFLTVALPKFVRQREP